MEKKDDFLPIDELTSQSHDFKKKWYGLSKNIESLTEYKSGFDEGFKEGIKSIYSDIDSCKDYVDSFEHSLKHYFPDKREDITWMTKKVYRQFEDFRVIVKRDVDVLENSKSLSLDLQELTAKLENDQAKLKKAEEKSGGDCRKYFDLKSEYTQEAQKIEAGLKKKLESIRNKFIEMTTPIVEGHSIQMSTSTVDIEGLFEHLVDKPQDIENITLVVKKGGFFGKKAESDIAKTSVLKYVSTEILDDVKPIKTEKDKLLKRVDSEFAELPKLEKICEESEKNRKKLEKPVEGLKIKISEIKKSEIFKFADYDGILETREIYLDKINESEKEVKEYLKFALLNLKGFTKLESDVEKRQLLEDIKGAREKAIAKEKDALKSRDELAVKTKELTSVIAAKEQLEKNLSGMTELKKSADKKTLASMKKIENVSKKAAELERLVQENFKKLEKEVATKLNEIAKAVKESAKGADEAKVGKKVESLRGAKK